MIDLNVEGKIQITLMIILIIIVTWKIIIHKIIDKRKNK